ncbi:39S ribosomal protein L11 [Capsaspora owczarzaki ATCC 30864]|uniref:Large ribosomal subunit protein uL11m n=1 Tax=Capsaspora owczarzaki (strain ATCC 30864) TaxID=595528 RepID=A0A0D2X4R4_CAPO3|nr:39S ribosomal protein L11 [Capsaspora owczarzaki ATCC 30864]KJE96514.1 39S ribosomal protein L11 [Capsaspora owczarzaki ATCC 30864]|eukprot:XP_004344448.1 39S ribosomal protein L11 [Capsaspora owczarzaki ATCC 30864]
MSKAKGAAGGAHIVVATLKLLIPAGKAAPAPPLGPALGQKGVAIGQFVKDFNDQTKQFVPGTELPVRLAVKGDRSYSYTVGQPTTAYFVLRAAGLAKGAKAAGKEVMGTISLRHVYEIAQIKLKDPSVKHLNMQTMAQCVIGTARALGVRVIDDRPKNVKAAAAAAAAAAAPATSAPAGAAPAVATA